MEGARGGTPFLVCTSDSRRAARALGLDADVSRADVADETLRGQLRDAPRIGRRM